MWPTAPERSIVAVAALVVVLGATGCDRLHGSRAGAPPGVPDARPAESGTPTVIVPDVTGRSSAPGYAVSVDGALARLGALGLAVAVDDVPLGSSLGVSVEEQSPAAGTRVPVGSTVRLVLGVTLGSPGCLTDVASLPDVRGLLLSRAAERIPGDWDVPEAPPLPPTVGLTSLFDAYVVTRQHDDASCGGVTVLDVALAEREAPRAPALAAPDLEAGRHGSVEAALSRLAAAGIAVEVVGLDDLGSLSGVTVDRQSPAPGARLAPGFVVRITAGRDGVGSPVCDRGAPAAPTPPDLRGHLLSEATPAIRGWWVAEDVPDLPPTRGLRRLADAYLITEQWSEPECGGSSWRVRFRVAVAPP